MRTSWEKDYLSAETKNQTIKSSKIPCNTLRHIFLAKKKHLRQQLFEQKLDLMEIKNILSMLNKEMGSDLENENHKKCLSTNPNESSNNETGDIHFTISTPKSSFKKFKAPLID